MPVTTTQLTIVNRGLQLLGQPPVSSIQDADRGARAMATAYLPSRDALLIENYWAFSIKRASLPASITTPVHTKENAFPLPGDFIILCPEDQPLHVEFPRPRDWHIEGRAIITDDEAPLLIRYVSSSVTESDFDPAFAEALSARIAMNCSEQLTQSNSKLTNVAAIYKDQVGIAKRRNAIITPQRRAPESPWISRRV